MRKLIVIVVVVACALAAWLVISPWMAMGELRDAAREGDKAALEQQIDFPALRESVKGELLAQVRAEQADNPLAVIGNSLAEGFVEGTVEAVVTPDGMSALLVTGNFIPARDGEKDIEWDVERQSFDTFKAVPRLDDGSEHPALVFKRDGLSWKLAGIDIPEAKPAAE